MGPNRFPKRSPKGFCNGCQAKPAHAAQASQTSPAREAVGAQGAGGGDCVCVSIKQIFIFFYLLFLYFQILGSQTVAIYIVRCDEADGGDHVT